MTDTPNPSPPSDSRLLNAIGGASLGGFIALLLGLSSAPVVASTLTVLLGAATIFLALQDQLSEPKRYPESNLRMGCAERLAGCRSRSGSISVPSLRVSPASKCSARFRKRDHISDL